MQKSIDINAFLQIKNQIDIEVINDRDPKPDI